jgi:hypothetical protein
MTTRKNDPRDASVESKGKVQITERDSGSGRALGARHTIDVDPSWLEGLDAPPEALPAPPPLPGQAPAAKARTKVAQPIPREEPEAEVEVEVDRVTPPLPPPVPARRSDAPRAAAPAPPRAAAPAPPPRIAPPAPPAAASPTGLKKPLVAPKKPLITPKKAGAPAPAKPAPQKKEG